MRSLLYLLIMLACGIHASSCARPEAKPSRDVFGLRLSMTKTETDARLNEIGKFARPERKRQEIWEIRDPSFSHIIIGFEKEGQLRFVTAVARKDAAAKPVWYSEIGPLEAAEQAGTPEHKNLNYQRKLPASGQ